MNFTTFTIISAISIGLLSCASEEKKEQEGPFKDVINFQKIERELQGKLIKKLTVGQQLETQIEESPDWVTELKPFVDANFNLPSNKDKYTRTESKSTLAGWRDVSWVSTDEKNKTKYAVYRFKDSVCVGASINVKRSSEAYTFKEMLTYIPNTGYSIDNSQNLSDIKGNSFYLRGEFDNRAQPWRMAFDIGSQYIPIDFWLTWENGLPHLTFVQGKQELALIATKTDSGFTIEIPVFQSYMDFDVIDGKMKGRFHNLDKGPTYVIDFTAMPLPYDQFFGYDPTVERPDFSGNWETEISRGDEPSLIALGIFERMGDDIIGTFATEAADFRSLQGKIVGDSFSLSTFDGSHLFLFTGTIKGDVISNGHFYSGNDYHTTWSAKRNPDFKLKDPNSLAHVTNESQRIEFSFPNMKGEMVSLSDEQFQNKVVILQILGSWCPNCLDETRYFNILYDTYHDRGLEIIGLGFERSPDFEKAKITLGKAIKDLEIPYPVLFASSLKESAKALPMLSPIKSYPTSILIDRTGKVVKVYTGFYGPSTGKYYDDYRIETESMIESLLDK